MPSRPRAPPCWLPTGTETELQCCRLSWALSSTLQADVLLPPSGMSSCRTGPCLPSLHSAVRVASASTIPEVACPRALGPLPVSILRQNRRTGLALPVHFTIARQAAPSTAVCLAHQPRADVDRSRRLARTAGAR
eukprot:767596-Hanusia_phi.AAC.2